MGIALPQLAPASEDRVSGALVIDGSLKFDGRSGGNHGYGHLRRTSSGASGGGTFTISWWAKRGSMRDDWQYMIAGDNGSLWGVGFPGSSGQRDSLTLFNGGHQFSSARFRDNSGWYHIVLVVNANSGPKLWVNGEIQSNTNTNASWNLNNTMYIGKWVDSGTAHNYDGYLAQYTCIDGLELGPSYFAYTDPLTGTWRPKKFKAEGTTVNNGTNWSAGLTGTADGSGAIGLMFDGDTTDGSWSNSSGYSVAFPNGGVTATNNIKIYGGSGSANWYVVIDGTKTTINAPGGNAPAWSATGVTGYVNLGPGTLTSIGTEGAGIAQNGEVSGIEIDGVLMRDNTTQNLAFGNAGFYLPLDGNTPIGQDLSGNGNNWTPVGFGGSTDITKATGAKPILNTGNGGTVARAGVFGSNAGAFYKTTSASNSGGQYVFEGLGTKPNFSFVRGATYTFDWSASSSHPLRFATAADAAGSTEYTDGTNVTGNVTKITVPHNAPDTLYYYCNVHNGMGNSISVTTDESKADPYAWKCVVAMPLVGANSDVSDQINSTSSTKAVATQNNAAAIYNRSNFYGGSFDFDGNGDRLVLSNYGTDLSFAGDFTMECWLYIDDAASLSNPNGDRCIAGVWSGSNGDWLMTYSGTGDHNTFLFQIYTGGSTVFFSSGVVMTPYVNRWVHLAVVRNSNSVQCFVDGIAKGTATSNSATFGQTSNVAVGGRTSGDSHTVTGSIQDFRIYNGVAKYTSNFIPAATNPNILPDTPSGVATKTQLTKITEGAVFIDRSSNDYLQAPASTDFRLDGQYCIEYFLNLTDYSNDSVYVRTFILDGPTGDGGSTNIHLNVNPSNGVVLFWSGSSELISGTISIAGGWHHVCLTRDSSNKTRLFIDGVLSGSADITTDYNLNSNQNRPRLGALGTTGGTSGHYSNWRIIKGSIPTEYQTSNTTNGTRAFYPPTEPLTNVTNTKLLCCQSNTEPGGAAVSPNVSGINDGTQWSSKVTPGSEFRTGFSAGDAFNGVTKTSTNDCAAPEINKVSFVEFDFGDGIPFTTLQMQCDDNNEGTVKVNNIDITSQLPTGSLTNTTITGVTSPLRKLRLDAVNVNASSVYLGSITIDGTMLVDPLTPNGGDPSATNFNPFNTDINTVSGQEGAYATLNPLISTVSLSDGNLKQAQTSGSWNVAVSSIPMSTGKWYCEVTLLDGNTFQIGIIKLDVDGGFNWAANFPLVDFPYGWGMVVDGGAKLRSDYIAQVNGRTDVAYNPTNPVAGDTIGMAYDADTQALTFYVNGISYGDTTSYWVYPPTPGEYVFGNSVVSNTDAVWNFGQKPFKFPPPDGFQPLTSSTVRPETVIARPDQYFGISTWTGNGGTQTISDLYNSPDFVWIKGRSLPTGDHALFDSVRGATKRLRSNQANPENTDANTLTAFNSDGFSLGSSSAVNNSTKTFVGWTWKAGGSSNTFNVDDIGYANASDVNMNVGSLTSSVYNLDQNWGSLMSASPGTFDQSPNFAFNGLIAGGSNRLRTSDNQATVTMTLSTPVTVSSQIKVIGEPGYTSSCTVTVGGVTYNSIFVQSTGTHTFNVSGSLTQMVLTGTSGGGRTYMEQMEIDGKILVNSGTTINAPSIAPTGCSVGTKQGFSIVKYTANLAEGGATIPHGLTQKPDFAIFKNIDSNLGADEVDWGVYHSGIGAFSALELNQDLSKQTYLGPFNNIEPNSSVFHFGGLIDGNIQGHSYLTNGPAGDDFIAYIWHDVPGLQKFGSYTSNNSADGPFIELGFRPALIWIKVYENHTNDWTVYDTTRETFNPSSKTLYLNLNAVEDGGGYYYIDVVSNGFKLRNSYSKVNGATNYKYIYCAWAEAPTFNLYGAQSNAR